MTDLYDNELPISDLAINYKENAEGADIWRVQGAFFRLNYDYRSKYLLEVNGRYDGSSKYAKDDRWAFFLQPLLVGVFRKKNSLNHFPK